MAHGEWERWCRDSANISPPQARKLITIAEELTGDNRSTWNEIGTQALYLIATMPEEARTKQHTIPSTGETKTVDEMTVRELREVKKALKDAQDTLSKKGYGCFDAWCESIGFNRMQANRLIQRHTLVTNCYEQTRGLLEDLPVSLTYEIAKPSAEATPAKAQAKAEVLQGDIDTLKAYRERIAELEAQAAEATDKAEQAETARQIAEARHVKITGRQAFITLLGYKKRHAN